VFAKLCGMHEEVGPVQVSRRAFARTLVGGVAAFLGLPVATDNLTIAILHPMARESFLSGTAMGVDEARRTATLFNKRLTVRNDLSGASVAISCFDDAMLREVALDCEKRGITLFNCWGRADELRRKLCRRTTFHIEASEKMYADARELAGESANVVLWDSRLERYGAAQLNDRYRAFAKRGMDGAAWAGWFAVKVAWESFLRARPVTSMEFDGHKGAPLTFRSWDHQLRQPLYASYAQRVVDVPDFARSKLAARDVLDTIGDKAGVQVCHF
jgi:hypothetical protein